MNCSNDKEMQEVAKRHIKFSEDYRGIMYLDSKKYPTFGWGHCYTAERQFETIREYADWLFDQDFQRAYLDYLRIVNDFQLWNLSCQRRMVLLDMCYNMNYRKVAKFVNSLSLLKAERWEEAARNLEQSAWYKQVGTRAKRLIRVIVTDQYPTIPEKTASGEKI
jgi:GH24 family phage-related lysozyme (muramidase)